jgi:hypothetical protein
MEMERPHEIERGLRPVPVGRSVAWATGVASALGWTSGWTDVSPA